MQHSSPQVTGSDPRPQEQEQEKSPRRPLRIELLEDRTAPMVIWGDHALGCP